MCRCLVTFQCTDSQMQRTDRQSGVVRLQAVPASTVHLKPSRRAGMTAVQHSATSVPQCELHGELDRCPALTARRSRQVLQQNPRSNTNRGYQMYPHALDRVSHCFDHSSHGWNFNGTPSSAAAPGQAIQGPRPVAGGRYGSVLYSWPLGSARHTKPRVRHTSP